MNELAIAKERVLDTKSDIERLEVRDFARKYYNIAVAAELSGIAVEAANLYQFTERKIVEDAIAELQSKGEKITTTKISMASGVGRNFVAKVRKDIVC